MSPTDAYTSATVQAETSSDKDREEEGNERYPTDFLKLAQSARAQARYHATSSVKTAWHRAYRAFRNQHFDGSKYTTSQYKGRTKLFRPKTRSAVRKNEASAAQALFATVDTVTISPNRADMMSTVSAFVMHEIINYRFDRSSGKDGMPWFMIAMGARQDSQITGMCISKQYWQWERKKPQQPENEESEQSPTAYSGLPADMEPVNEDGLESAGEYSSMPEMDDMPAADPMDAQPSSDPNDRSDIVLDRPWIELIPPENIELDPAAPWYNPVQEGGYLRVKFPMHLHEVRGMMEQGSSRMGGGKWKPYDDQMIASTRDDTDQKAVRQAREGGRDRLDDEASKQGDLQIVWVTENFFRWEGQDYHFWSLGERCYLTDPVPTEEAYPAFDGARPYVGGFGIIESHTVWPMSPVESWQPLQQEANDLTNLRLDNIKQHLSPLTKARRGTGVDLKSLRNRGPDSTILVNDMDDVTFDRPPDVSGSSYQEMNYLDAGFDELAGNFSGASVQTNRSLNETVGGLKMLSGSANGMTEYDLRIWTETWVEPTIRQIVMLERYYEDNPEVLSIAGERAKVWEKYGVEELSQDMIDQNVLTRVDVGIGSTDPNMQLEKLKTALGMLGELLPFMNKDVKVKSQEIAETIMGHAGYKDGMRFLEISDPQQQQDPKQAADAAKAEATLKAKEIDAQSKQAETQARIQSDERMKMAELSQQTRENAMDRRLEIFMEALRGDIAGQLKAQEQQVIDRQAPLPAIPAGQQSPAGY